MADTIEENCRYRIIRKIADGGMGSVYEAILDGVNGFQKIVGLKVIRNELMNDEEIVKLFIKEAKLVSNLVHECIVQIYHLGQTSDGSYFIVMEYVKGLTLAEFVQFHATVSRKNIPPQLAIFICSKIARGLEYAHNKTDGFSKNLVIVHRDVCPTNILLTTEGLPKITDFGIASVASNINSQNQGKGKTQYRSPEQEAGQPVDFRSDIYSLAIILLELLTNRFTDGKQIDINDNGELDWSILPANCPVGIRGIFRNALAKDPENRYTETSEFARDLEYAIYKDGYGPTIKTLENYLRKQFPYLYGVNQGAVGQDSESHISQEKAGNKATVLAAPEQSEARKEENGG